MYEIISEEVGIINFNYYSDKIFKTEQNRLIDKIPTKPFHIVIKPGWWDDYPHNNYWELIVNTKEHLWKKKVKDMKK